jgi:ATP-dependent helicase Lhr and Lhr-like helicase
MAGLFADPNARYPFLQLADRQAAPLAEFNASWWRAVWSGEVTADTLSPLRQGAARDFKLAHERAAVPRRSRSRIAVRVPRYRRSAFADPWTGVWHLTPQPSDESDALIAQEDARERGRLLIDRYGVVCRELANREGGRLRWPEVFRALRVMELAGEVVAGYFFEGLSGPQFAAPAAVSGLQGSSPAAGSFWMNALDPASPCGLGLDWPELPQRRAANYLAFVDGALALVVEKGGKRLNFLLPVNHLGLGDAVMPMAYLLARDRRLALEQINGLPAADSPYLPALERLGTLVSDHRSTWLENATLPH